MSLMGSIPFGKWAVLSTIARACGGRGFVLFLGGNDSSCWGGVGESLAGMGRS